CIIFFTVSSPTNFYTLSLHDALPICDGTSSWRDNASSGCTSLSINGSAICRVGNERRWRWRWPWASAPNCCCLTSPWPAWTRSRSEEHTSELQSLAYLVCRLLLEKKK